MEDGNIFTGITDRNARLAFDVVQLRKKRVASWIPVSNAMLVKRAGNPPYVLAEPHDMLVRNMLAARMESYVWEEDVYVEVAQWPATWWDHLKARWVQRGWLRSRLGRWWLQRHPIKHASYHIDVTRIYPTLLYDSPADVLKIAVPRKL